MLAVFAAVSVWVLALDVWQVVVHGRVWTGTDGVYLADQLQYLAWVRDASHHPLVSNLFVLRSTPADYFQPAIAISGGLSALGLAPWLSLLLWKPVAVGGCFLAVRQYVCRSLTGLWSRRAALVLALFFGSVTIIGGSAGVIGDLFPGFLSWGYVFALMALAAIVAALVVYDRAHTRGRIAWWPGLLGALASSLHPWQGEVLIAIVLGAELTLWLGSRPARPRLAQASLTVALTALPLAYYAILGRADLSWRLARVASKHTFSIWSIALAIGPLLLLALPAYGTRPRRFLPAATRVWPAAALAVFVVSATGLSATPLHAFQGITIPLAVLAVEGYQRLGALALPRSAVLAGLAVAAFTIPATVDELAGARTLAAPRAGSANFITSDERRALDYLARDPQPGGVISRSYLGLLVPGATGRHTLVGDCLWSEPHCASRLVAVRNLFEGTVAPEAARAFVRSSGARFLLADCRPTADLVKLLGSLIRSVHRFGCARVYETSA